MATQLSIYNSALRILKHPGLAALTDNVEARHILDDEYDECLAWCLEQGLWNFALRSSQMDASVSVEPEFGFTYAFEQPSDFVRLNKIAGDADFVYPYEDYDYVDENGWWLAREDPIYVSYVSNGASYGGGIGNWTSTYLRFVQHELAFRAAPQVTAFSATEMESLERRRNAAMRDARSKDALNQGAIRPPPGRLVRSRVRSAPADGRPYWRR